MSFAEMLKVPRHVVIDVPMSTAWCAHCNAGREGYDEIYFAEDPDVKYGDTIGLRSNGHVWATITAKQFWKPGDFNDSGERVERHTVEIDCEETRAHYMTHRGYFFERTKWNGPPSMPEYVNVERIFAERWELENRRNPGINYGHGILQDLMLSAQKHGQLPPGVSPCVTPREAAIVAEVIQWLGSNCGREFLRGVLKEARLTIDTI